MRIPSTVVTKMERIIPPLIPLTTKKIVIARPTRAKRTAGLLKATNPGTADAAGINVIKYKYLSTCIGAGLAGLGGLYFVMEYSGGTWTDNGFGDRGWLAVALVIFALWKPLNAIWGAFQI